MQFIVGMRFFFLWCCPVTTAHGGPIAITTTTKKKKNEEIENACGYDDMKHVYSWNESSIVSFL